MFSDREHVDFLNGGSVLAAVRRRLGELGFRDELEPAADGVDAVLHLTSGGGASRSYGVQVKQRLTAELATAVHIPPAYPALVVAPSISDPAADRLRARGIDYVDTAGNARLAWDDVLIDIRGRRKPTVPLARTAPRGSRAFGKAGLKVAFVLLSWPEMASLTLRELAAASGVSLGTAQMVVDELTAGGYLYESAGGRRLARGGELLNRWSEAYSIALGPSLALGEFSAGDLSWWPDSEHELRTAGALVGGEAAASLIDPHLRPSSLTLYVEETPLSLIGRHRLVRAEEDGNVHLRRRFWQVPEETAWSVPSTLVYADLLASGDPRQREHGDRIRTSDDRLTRLDRT
ncbi:type IV toxin-antitoxin system AbiEi family antitoxin [Amycolatopsis sp. 195334CR]|uniref:type IV toxin-antitoxin system AbiEi family antitoxin n=1 Tax=Amycolatopsis sp. 195334CR TaxID=2814588 RepID=UPI001A8FBE60|nr:type IV toxin-antitoxin system AbiEi family antitoxin [Amycolatopsis sp. 195334CR]MBN6034248.1 hypothetical protein [Amycolatopsis sp. 195334CR]